MYLLIIFGILRSNLRVITRCISYPDLLRLFKINTCLGFSTEELTKNPKRDAEIRMIVDDFKSKNRKSHVAMFRTRRVKGVKDFITSKQFNWLFHDIFGKEPRFIFTRSDGTAKEVPMTRKNTQEFMLKELASYYFDYLQLNKIMHRKASSVDLDIDMFWAILYYLIETRKVHLKYTKFSDHSSLDTLESLKKTLEEYKQKYNANTDPQVKEALMHTIEFLQSQIDKLEKPEEKAANKFRELEGNWKKALKELFLFYSRQQKTARKDQTFDNYRNDLQNMSVGEWLKFCKDFNLNPQNWLKERNDPKAKEHIEKLARELNTTVVFCY
jgi:hypothetical protein